MFAATASGKGELDTTVEFVSSTNKQILSGQTNTTITLSNIQADDVVFVAIAAENYIINSVQGNNSTLNSAAWTQILQGTIISNPALGLWQTVATGTSVTVDTNFTPNNDRDSYVICLFAFRGLNTSDPTLVIGRESANYGSSIPLTDFTGVGYDTYLLGIGVLDDDINVTFTMPSGYTEIFQGESSGDNGDNATMAIAYGASHAGYASSGKAFSASSSDSYNSLNLILVPSGKDGTPPVVTGAQTVTQAAGSTSVATYSADETVTWSLEGTDANLLSISSAGVVTYNSATTLSVNYITVVATNDVGLITSYPVEINNYTSGGTAGGGITLVTSDSGSTAGNTTLTLNGLQSGDLVFFSYASDSRLQSTPAGYTQIGPARGFSPRHRLYYKVTTSTSESLSFSIAGSTNRMAVGMFAFRGVDNTNPVLSEGALTLSNGTTANIPDHFILADTVELAIGGLDDDSNVTATQPTGYTVIIDQNVASSGSSAAYLNISYKNVNGNTTETGRQIVFSNTDGHMGYSLTLMPD